MPGGTKEDFNDLEAEFNTKKFTGRDGCSEWCAERESTVRAKRFVGWKAVEAIDSEMAQNLAKITASVLAVPSNVEASALVQKMRKVVVSMREITQSNQKVLDMYRSREKPTKFPLNTNPIESGNKGKWWKPFNKGNNLFTLILYMPMYWSKGSALNSPRNWKGIYLEVSRLSVTQWPNHRHLGVMILISTKLLGAKQSIYGPNSEPVGVM